MAQFGLVHETRPMWRVQSDLGEARTSVFLRPLSGYQVQPAAAKKKANRERLAFIWWRRRDSLFHIFRYGLDYAFIRFAGCGACYPNPSP